MSTRTSIFALFAASLVGCSGGSGPQKPMGLLPEATTTAQPEWLPFAIRVGKSIDPDPREKHLTLPRRLTEGWTVDAIAWSPDAKALAVVAKRPQEKTASLYLLPLSSGAPERISAEGEEVLGVSGTASEPWRVVYWVSDKGGTSLRERQASGERKSLDVGALKVKSAAVSADGSALFVIGESGGERGVFATPAAGAGPKLLVADRAATGSPAISADRSYVAWPTEENGQKRIAMASVEGRGSRPVVNAPARSPSFLPGTTRLLFSSDIDAAGGEIYAADLGPEGPATAGAARPERITFAQAENPVAAPTGRIIAFTSRRGGATPDLYLARWVDDP
ncbi:MAG: hypothetical protein HOV80_33905 [Polyangiaceae bacterium]|nr:hypothetical protein [Polyangiaceae bacterium]